MEDNGLLSVSYILNVIQKRQADFGVCDSTHKFKDVKIVIFLSPLKEVYVFYLRRKASSVQEESELA